jgi:hypothetical protein
MEPEKEKTGRKFYGMLRVHNWMGNYGCKFPQFYELSVKCPFYIYIPIRIICTRNIPD